MLKRNWAVWSLDLRGTELRCFSLSLSNLTASPAFGSSALEKKKEAELIISAAV